jgi:adenine-specific DNA-methyltransferase
VLDKRGNLYLYFIERCLHHLAPGGELIFITPRDFLKTTSATALNQLLYAEGTITHAIELGDAAVFADAVPNCLIWRFVRGDFTRQTKLAKFGTGCRLSEELAAPAWTDTCFLEAGGHLLFSEENYPLRLADIAYVKVGAVSGADDIYRDASLESIGNRDFVCSETERTGKTRRMLWCGPYEPRPPKTVIEYLLPHRDRLIRRGVRAFHDGNWWEWGRGYPLTRAPRVYVNGRTRAERPFFLHPCLNYDGAVLAIFPHDPGIDLVAFCAALNNVHWADLGFVCDGRHLFTQRSLENSPLPASFSRFLPAAPDPATPAGG